MNLRALPVLIVIGLSIRADTVAQSEREFIDKVEGFKITLAGDWQPVSYTDAVGRQRTEFVSHDRAEGLLKIARERLAGRALTEKVHGDLEDLKLRYACVYTGQEAISGLLSGVRVALYYFEDGRWIVGTHYYLKDGDAVWILRFTGRPGSTGMARETTDRIVRTFCSVCDIPVGPAKTNGELTFEPPRVGAASASPLGVHPSLFVFR